MKKIGILRGAENTFPEALISFINAAYTGSDLRVEFVALDSVSLDSEPEYDVILDRISPEVPFYRSFLKWAALRGTCVVNNPFWWGADDKFVGHVLARLLGVAAPPTVTLPHKQPPPNTQPMSFRNLRIPVDWPAIFARVGFPAFLKPHESGNRRGVTKVRNPQEFFAAYDASGSVCMMLQASVEFEDYFRCYCIGGTEVHLMRYNPSVPHDQRYSAVSRAPIPGGLRHRLERDVRALCNALSYDVNCVEFAVRGGVPYAVDVINPVPDADRHSVGEANFDWVVRTTAALLVAKAEETRVPQFEARRTLAAQVPLRRLKIMAKPPQVSSRLAAPRSAAPKPPAPATHPAVPPPQAARPAAKARRPEAAPAKTVSAAARPAKPQPPSKPAKPAPPSRRGAKPAPAKAAGKAKAKKPGPASRQPKTPAGRAAGSKAKTVATRPVAAPKHLGGARPAKPAQKPTRATSGVVPGRAKAPARRVATPPRQLVKKPKTIAKAGPKPARAKSKPKAAKARAAAPKAKQPEAKGPQTKRTQAKRTQSKTSARSKGPRGRAAGRR